MYDITLGSHNNSDWKGYSHLVQLPATRQDQLVDQTKLLSTLPCWVVKNSTDGNCTTLLCKVNHCWTVLLGKKLFLPFGQQLSCSNL